MATPVGDRVLIRPVELKRTSAGGIILPDSAAEKERPTVGTVVEVGPGVLLESGTYVKPQVKKGDKVYFAPFACQKVTVSGEDFLVAKSDSVLLVLED